MLVDLNEFYSDNIGEGMLTCIFVKCFLLAAM